MGTFDNFGPLNKPQLGFEPQTARFEVQILQRGALGLSERAVQKVMDSPSHF